MYVIIGFLQLALINMSSRKIIVCIIIILQTATLKKYKARR